MTAADFSILLPEVLLALFSMTVLLLGVYGGQDRLASLVNTLCVAALLLAALLIGMGEGAARSAFGEMFLDDAFARFAKVVLLLAAAAVLLMSRPYMERRGLLRFEYPVLVVLAVVGMMVMVSAGDLMVLYMGLELQSLALYVVASLRRDSLRSTEAGLKYFVLGALSSGLLLFGASLIYGFSGTTLFSGILSAAGEERLPPGLLIGLVLMMSGLAFKVSAVPFHMWTPDVYEGSPSAVTAFFATAPKVAAMALLARLLFEAFGAAGADWSQVLALLSVASMFVGALAAIGQRDIKRLMAYSSIAHMGFALMGLAAGSALGVQAMLVYMAIYVTMNIGTFAFILSMERDGRAVSDISSLHMLSRGAPLKALAMLVLLFSLAGVPPLVGFFGKFYVLKAALEAGLGWLALAGVIASVIGAFYYLRLVYFMYFGQEGEGLDRAMAPAQRALLLGAAAAMLLGVINLFGVDGAAATAALALVE